jgi:TolB protein
VSFESRKPVVYVHDVASGQRRLLANFKGSNSAPAWAPDGRTLAVTLSREGGSQLYTIDATGGEPRRLTQSSSIDTEPVYSADGRSIYFVSDRGGAPQIYRDGRRRRQPDARHLHRHLQHLAVHQPAMAAGWPTSRASRCLQAARDGAGLGHVHAITDTTADESPSFAPNGKLIVYATHQKAARRS